MKEQTRTDFMPAAGSLRSRKTDIVFVDFTCIPDERHPVEPFSEKRTQSKKHDDFRLPLIEKIKTYPKRHIPRQRYERIESYRKKMYDPQMCARSYRLDNIRAHKLIDGPAQVSPPKRIDMSPPKLLYKRLSANKSDLQIETVPLEFLVMKSATEKYLAPYQY